jgi:hypothetical protein
MKKMKYTWFGKFEKAVSLTVNTTILLLLGLGYSESSLILLLVKIGSSYIMSMLALFLDKKQSNSLLEDTTTEDDTVFPSDGSPKPPTRPFRAEENK